MIRTVIEQGEDIAIFIEIDAQAMAIAILFSRRYNLIQKWSKIEIK